MVSGSVWISAADSVLGSGLGKGSLMSRACEKAKKRKRNRAREVATLLAMVSLGVVMVVGKGNMEMGL